MTSPIWISGIIALLILSAITLKQNLKTNYPWFCAYVYFSATAWVIGALSILNSLKAYVWFYCFHEVIVDIFTILVFVEVWRNVFGPFSALPRSAPRAVLIRLLGATVVVASMVSVLATTHEYRNFYVIMRIDQAFSVLLLATLFGIVMYSRLLGVSWGLVPHNIAIGFAAFLTVDVFSTYLISQMRGGTPLLVRAGASITYVLTIGIWCWNLRKKEPEPVMPTGEEILAMALQMTEIRNAALACGIGVAREPISTTTR